MNQLEIIKEIADKLSQEVTVDLLIYERDKEMEEIQTSIAMIIEDEYQKWEND